MLSLVLVAAVACSNDGIVPEGSGPRRKAREDRGVAGGGEGPSGKASAPHARHARVGRNAGRLSGSRRNVRLVGKLELTERSGGISDVSAFGNHAYLGAFRSECPSSGGAGTGVHVVDIADPTHPRKVSFIPAHPNSYVGEGVHVIQAETEHFSGEILIHNNEPCDNDEAFMGGVSLWDVTDPRDPRPLAQGVGDNTPGKSPNVRGVSSSHSAQGFTIGDGAYVVLVDNEEPANVDILDISDPRDPEQIAETGLRDWPSAQSHFGNGGTIYHHDMQTKRIEGHDYLLLSYWDAGWILLDVDDPSEPRFVADHDYGRRDPLIPSVPPGGNAHEAFWSSDNRFILATGEDFSPRGMILRVGSGSKRVAFPAERFGWSASLPGNLGGTPVWGGSGCDQDLDDNGRSDRSELSAAARPRPGRSDASVVVFGRGDCFFSTKVETGQLAGYDAVIIGQRHRETLEGRLPDAFTCGAQGHDFEVTVPALCLGHRGMHRLFGDAPAYEGPEAYTESGDMPSIGTRGRRFEVRSVFDGYGYIHLLDARTLDEIDAYAIPQALDPKLVDRFGSLSVHEIKTDPRLGVDLAYSSYYKGGLRVLAFGDEGLREVGHYVSRGGSNFWGTFPHILGTD
ncbi:MAG: hypothetical protein ACRDJ5_04265, partial [Actinomycetota bacterium]